MDDTLDVIVPDGRRLGVHRSTDASAEGGTVFWHHGTLRDGPPPRPFATAAARLRLRWVSVARPGHGRSTSRPGRTIGAAAADIAAVADQLGVERFAVAGHSTGAPSALACAALLPERVVAVVAVATYAPRDCPDLDWYAHVDPAARLALRAAESGRERGLAFARSHPDLHWLLPRCDAEVTDPASGWFRPSETTGEARLTARVDDHVALVSPWGFQVADVRCPTVLLHGEADTVVSATHSRATAESIPRTETWIAPSDAHFTILGRCDAALEWLRRQV